MTRCRSLRRRLFDSHPEPRRRRGTSQAHNRYREPKRLLRRRRPNVSRKRPFQLRGPSARFASLGMTSRQPYFSFSAGS
jgi:hypothetical protein